MLNIKKFYESRVSQLMCVNSCHSYIGDSLLHLAIYAERNHIIDARSLDLVKKKISDFLSIPFDLFLAELKESPKELIKNHFGNTFDLIIREVHDLVDHGTKNEHWFAYNLYTFIADTIDIHKESK